MSERKKSFFFLPVYSLVTWFKYKYKRTTKMTLYNGKEVTYLFNFLIHL